MQKYIQKLLIEEDYEMESRERNSVDANVRDKGV